MAGEPRTEAGKRLLAALPSDAATAASPEFVRHLARAVIAIEAEAAASVSDELDAAWAEAEAALPDKGWLSIVGPDQGGKGEYVVVAYSWREGFSVPVEEAKSYGTPRAALCALTERLRAEPAE